MMFGIDIENFVTALLSIIGCILTLEKAYKWIYEKFNYAHKKVNEANDTKETISELVEEIKNLKQQNEVILDISRSLLKDKLKKECSEYVERGSITQEELEEYHHTYELYENAHGNGIGTKYHNMVMNLPIKNE